MRKSLVRPSTSGAAVAPIKKRKSSVRATYGNAGRMKDPRPISDRAFKDRSIRQLVEFLVENSYPFPISPKLLHSPQTKDFVRIFEFLMNFIWTKYKVGNKIEEEVPAMLKNIGYPFSITKSAMFSVGSPLTWPSLLAALSWLREQIEYALSLDVDQLLFRPSNDDEFDGVLEQKIFFDYCEKAYKEFMEGSDTFEALDEELSKQFAQAGSQTNMEQMVHDHKHLQAQLEILLKEPDQLLTLKDTESLLRQDMAQLHTYNNELDLHVKQQEERDRSLTAEFAVLKAEKQQLCQLGDVQRINLARQELLRQVEATEKEVATLDNQIWEEDMQISKSHDKLETACSEYHKKAQMLQLIPVTAENACGIDYELKATTNKIESDKFVNTIRPALSQVKKQCTERVHMQQERLMKEKEVQEQVNDMLSEKKEALAVLENKLKRLEVSVEHKRDVMVRESQSIQERTDELHEELSTTYKHMPTSIDDAMLAYQQQRQRNEQDAITWEKDEKNFISFLMKAAGMIMEHKHVIQEHMGAVCEQLQKTLEQQTAASEEV
ncbi:Kinetochore protein NDC80-like [Lamellibrachia satsuma]|nr:Kinetochore protein NDC80-like [Lamellibrachia satsuma]